ncbi:hypothetical protein AcV5_000242 [Taiwanofungus camphoratus]|nr:hypothetical protein AcV5_000242 [Antrodia cinnamomea]
MVHCRLSDECGQLNVHPKCDFSARKAPIKSEPCLNHSSKFNLLRAFYQTSIYIESFAHISARFDTILVTLLAISPRSSCAGTHGSDGSPTARDPDMSPGEAQDELAAWLEKMQLDDGHALGPQRCGAPALIASRVSIYRCTWCGNPSAVLRKCSGCGQTRYCDTSCQKAHWGEHKRACEPA